ncbi:MAG: DUF4347 domain-containing protein [Planctomycetes bacterium]|nr:DUF4347 domain-containing protein [Planctomycetota bacterium]
MTKTNSRSGSASFPLFSSPAKRGSAGALEALESRQLLSSDISGGSLVFISSDVKNADELAKAFPASEVVMLDAQRDGIDTVSNFLSQRSGLESVNFITHGSSGRVQLGATNLDGSALSAVAGKVAGWGKALSATGDILLWGCSVGEGQAGAAFVKHLATLTGADVAASDNTSGGVRGDWKLEVRVGRVSSSLPILPAGYQFTLAAPTITGTVASQAVQDSSTISPFSGVTIGDTDNDLLSVQIQLDNPNKGIFTSASLTASGFSDEGSGRYLFFGTPSESTTAIRLLSYNPTDNRVPVGFTETSRFAITVDDATSEPAVDAVTSVRSTSANDAPSVGGFTTTTTINDTATTSPFSSLTITDADPLQTLTMSITLDDAAKGVFTPASLTATGFSTSGGGVYTYSARAGALRDAARALVFDPTNDRVAVGSTEITTFSVQVHDGYTSAFDSTTTVTSTSVNDAPVISGTSAGHAVEDNATTSPFPAVTVTDPDPSQTLTATVTLDTAAKGAFTPGSLTTSGFTHSGGGVYTRTGSASALTTALRALVFAPTENRAAVGSTETTTFTLDIDDGVAAVASDSTATVISTPHNDASVISGTASNQAVLDNATVSPFSGVTIADADSPAQTLSISVTLDAAAKGTFTGASLTASGFSAAGGGVYTFSGTASAATTAIRQLVFMPTENRVMVGSSETTTFAISVSDGLIAATTNSATSVVSSPFNDAASIGGASAGQAVNDNATLSPFSSITVTDADVPAQTFTVTVALDTAAKGAFTAGSLTTSGFASAGGGSYTFSGTAAQAQTALRALVFDPTDNRVAAGMTETTTFTITVSDGVAADVTDSTTTVVSTSVNVAPSITGATAGQAVLDNATVQPFSGVTIADVDGDTLSISVSLDTAAKGAFTGGSLTASGFTDAGGGVYTFSGTASAATTAIRALVFAPTENRAAVGSTETTTFTISADDSIAAATTDSTTTAVSTPFNDVTTITGASAAQAVNDNATLTPFSGVTIGDVDSPAQTLSISVTLDASAKGVFTAGSLAASGFTDAGSGVYTFTGTAAAATTAIRQLVFNPTDNRVAVGATETTTFTIVSSDSLNSDVTNSTTTVVSTSMNDAPSVTGATAGQAVNDTATITPFSGVTIADVDPSTTISLTVTLDAAAKGVFTAGSLTASGFTDAGSGVYTFSGTAAAATTAIRALVFDPSDNRVTPGATETTTFTVDAGDGTTTTLNTTTTAVSTSVNDAPSITGASAAQAVNDNATLTPFAGVTIGDVDSPAQTLSISVALDASAKGVFTAGSLTASGFVSAGGGVYTFSGTAADATTAIRQLVFNPANDRVNVGSTETTTFTISADDGVASAVTDNTTTAVSTSINDAPSITGTSAGQAVNDNATLSPFSGVTIADVDPGQTLSVSVSLDSAAKGAFTSGSLTTSGFVSAGGGVYTFSGTASAATTAIRALVFAPTENRVAATTTETTTFTITANDAVASDVTDSTTTAVSTSVNDAPSITGASAGQAVNDNDTLSPFSGVTIADADTGHSLAITVSLDTAAKGAFTAGSLTASGFVSAGGGVYTFSGTGAQATTAIRQLVFNPANDRVNVGMTETTTFTISADDGIAAATTDNTATAVSTSINDAPAITGSVASQAVNDTATLTPFSGVTISDVDPDNQTLTISVTLDASAKGVFTAGSLTASGFVSAGGGVYTFSGDAAAATTAIRQLVFNPANDRVAVGNTETTTFTISADDGVAAAVTDNTTTAVSTSMNDAPSVTGASAGQAVNDNDTLSPFSAVTLADVDPAQSQSVSVTLDVAAKGVFTPGSLSASGFTQTSLGVYTFTGTAAQATTAIRQLVYSPSANRVAVGSTETTTFTISIDDGVASAVTDATTTAVSTSINDAPSVTGASAGQEVFDNASLSPFSGVTIGDVDNPAQTLSITVSVDTAAKGTFSAGSLTASGFVSAGGGSYTFSGSASAATTAIRQLVFVPTENRAAIGSTETSTFTIAVDDGASGTASNSTTTVVSTPYNDATVISGASVGVTVNDDANTSPFSSITVSDADSPAQTMTATVSIDSAAKGVFTSASLTSSGFTDAGDGAYTFSGTASQITTALRALVFNPTNDRVAVGSTETSTFTISVDDGVATPVTDANTTVVSTSMNDAPSVSGSVASQAVNDDSTITPFATVLITDNDTFQTQSISVSIDNAAKGAFTSGSLAASGFVSAGGGVYTFSGTAEEATNAIRQLVFSPTANRLTPGSTETSTFTISVDDGVAAAATDSTTSAVSTSINDAPSITGVSADQAVLDNATVSPFTGVTIADADPGTTLSISVTLDASAKGVFTPTSLTASGFADAGGGVYTFSGSASAATTAIRQLVYAPSENRVVVGTTETTTFSISADDSLASPTVDTGATVVSTPFNDPTVITGAVAGQTVNDNDVLAIFQGVTISDPDSPAQTLTVTVTIANPNAAVFTPGSRDDAGFNNVSSGVYTFTGTAAQATSALRMLVLNPTDNRTSPNSTETIGVTITVEDGYASPVTNTTTTVDSTSVNDAPSIADAAAGQAVNDSATISPFSSLTLADVDPGTTLTVSVAIDTAAKGAFTSASLTASGFTDAGGGVYTYSGSPTAATTAIRALVFRPTNNRNAVGDTETSSFTITVNDGVASDVTNTTTTVVVTSVNDAPTVTGAVASQAVNDTSTVSPFTGVSIADVDLGQTLTASVSIDNAAKGAFTADSLTASGFTDAGGGFYTFSGSGSAITAAIRQLVFNPSDNRVAVGSTETTTFTISVNDGAGAPVANSTTTALSLSMNDAPSVSGAEAGQAVNDNATLQPFSGFTVADVDPGQSQTVTVSLDTAAKGAFTPASLTASGFATSGGGVYTFTGTAAAATTAIRQLVFRPTNNRNAVGATETTTFAVSVNDGSAEANSYTTTVVTTSVNDASVISGIDSSGTTIDDSASTLPFSATTFTDADAGQQFTFTVTLDDDDKGSFTSASLTASGFADAGGGVYTFSGSAAQGTAAIRQLVFRPANNRNAVGVTESTTFTVTINDGATTPVTNTNGLVRSTSVNDAPTISGTASPSSILDTQTSTPFSGVTIADVDPSQSVTVSVSLDNPAKGAFTPASLTASGFADAGGGVYTFSGSASAATTAIRALVFTPTFNRLLGGQSETTTFAVSVNDGVATPVNDNGTTQASTGVNELPTATTVTPSLASIRTGQTVTFTATGIADTDGTVQAVKFYRDSNASGTLDDADELLGADTNGTDGWSFTATAASNWGTGSLTFFAAALDNDGEYSPAPTTSVAVQTNTGPLVATLSGSLSSATYGQSVTMTATGVSTTTGTIRKVEFYVDTNGNGVWDSRDKKLGTDSSATGGYTNTFKVPTNWAVGPRLIFARADAGRGFGSAASFAFNVAANTAPTVPVIGSSVSTLPTNRKVTLSAPGVTDSDGTIKYVEYFADSNGNGVFDAADKKISRVSSSKNNWGLNVTVNRAWIISGSVRFFARAIDNNAAVGSVVSLLIPAA